MWQTLQRQIVAATLLLLQILIVPKGPRIRYCRLFCPFFSHDSNPSSFAEEKINGECGSITTGFFLKSETVELKKYINVQVVSGQFFICSIYIVWDWRPIGGERVMTA